jgi:hypothetical protein
MFGKVYYGYLFSVLGGIVLIFLVLLFVGFGDGAEDQREKQIVLQAQDLIISGKEFQGLVMLEKLAEETQNKDAYRILADNLSNPKSEFFDVDTAMFYASKYKNKAKDGDEFYSKIEARVLLNWDKQ